MARVKRGVHTKKKHKAVMDRAKGFRGARSRRFKVAKEAVMHAERYAYRDRRARKGDFRKLWITRINAAARMDGLSYSRFMHGLKLAEVTVDRKNLADMAVREPEGFSALVAVAKDALGEPAGSPRADSNGSGTGSRAGSGSTTTAAEVVDNAPDTDTVGTVESDRIVDDATAPEASEEAREAVVDDESADESDEVEAANVVESPEADEVAVDVDEEVEAVDASDPGADDDATGDVSDADVSQAPDGAPGDGDDVDEAPYGEGSAAADDDGAGPEGWTVKGNADSMLFHTEESPSYDRTKAEVWFETEQAAAAAGFERWDHEAPADDDVEVVEADDEE